MNTARRPLVALSRHPLVAVVLLLLAIAVAVALRAPSAGAGRAATPTVQTAEDALEAPLLAKINDVRRAHGLGAVTASAALADAAAGHASSMGRLGYFSHDSADGSDFSKRIRPTYGPAGYWRWLVGENLLWVAPDTTPQEAIDLWMASPTHRHVLLTPEWHEVGIAAVHVTNAPGVYGGQDVTIVAADFGARD